MMSKNNNLKYSHTVLIICNVFVNTPVNHKTGIGGLDKQNENIKELAFNWVLWVCTNIDRTSVSDLQGYVFLNVSIIGKELR